VTAPGQYRLLRLVRRFVRSLASPHHTVAHARWTAGTYASLGERRARTPREVRS
jgi:hypothetical protein